uniref:Ubiquitin-like domain-containing protein n=1 Tax=Tanacetum cinerariifolium TaxID=118510 RepID=A0A699ITR7_TANCI|nr:hypothetical protein [Tanacetum cinerariifolium]
MKDDDPPGSQQVNTIANVKAMIRDKEGLFVGEQLDDSRILASYYIQKESALRLVDYTYSRHVAHDSLLLYHDPPLVLLNPTGNTLYLEVDNSNTIDHVKAMIQDNEEWIHPSLVVTLRKIFVKTYTGKAITLQVNSNTIGNVKAQIHHEEGIAPNEQRLIFEGTHLEDEQTLIFYGIHNSSTICLEAP